MPYIYSAEKVTGAPALEEGTDLPLDEFSAELEDIERRKPFPGATLSRRRPAIKPFKFGEGELALVTHGYNSNRENIPPPTNNTNNNNNNNNNTKDGASSPDSDEHPWDPSEYGCQCFGCWMGRKSDRLSRLKREERVPQADVVRPPVPLSQSTPTGGAAEEETAPTLFTIPEGVEPPQEREEEDMDTT